MLRSVALLGAVSLLIGGHVSAECLLPGPAPVLPRGASATAAEMKAAHDSMQSFVNALEKYQACVENQIKDAPADTPKFMKNAWRAQGNAGIDEAHAAAEAYAEQLKAFKSRP
jgi:hypothetical protein